MQVDNKTEQPFFRRSLEEIVEILQHDYHQLDEPFAGQLEIKLIGGTTYRDRGGKIYPPGIQLVEPPKILGIFKVFPVILDMLRALWLIGSADQRTCILVDGGPRFGILTCILNSFLPMRKRKILLWEAYIPTSKLKRWLARRMILGTSLTVVYSRKQIGIQAKLLKVPTSKFIFIPWMAIHSKSPPINMQIGGYVFSGGTSRRDYQTLFEAVRDTGIPVIVSTANPRVFATLEVPKNVILLAALVPETAFTRLMAASCFVVVPIKPHLVRGAGEGTVLTAMWHGRAVILADDISTFEYIEDGVTGYVTPPGDAARLRERVIELWNNPKKANEMGRLAQQVVAANLTEEHFSQRLMALGAILASSK